MATVALSTVGNILLPGVGGFIGAAVGSYLDSNFLMPSLFPQDPVHGPRLADLKISSAAEGDPASVVQGEGVRVAGTVIYLSPLIQEKHEEDVGGKGGGGQTVVTYDYYVNVAVAFAMNEVEDFDILFADGKKVWARVDPTIVEYASDDPSTDIEVELQHDTDPIELIFPFEAQINDGSLAQGQSTVQLTSVDRDPLVDEIFNVENDPTDYCVVSYSAGLLTFRPVSQQLWVNGDDVDFTGFIARDTWMVIKSRTDLGAPDLSVFKSGSDVVVTNLAHAENNGGFRCISAKLKGDGTTELKLRNLNGSPETSATIRLEQANPQYWAGLADAIRLYYGTESQLPDSFLEAEKGAGEVPAFRGVSYAFVERLHLGDFGNRVPNFEAVVRERTNRQLPEVVSFLMKRAAFADHEYDVTGLAIS